ncbi:MAG TPA: alpha/beta hydrolase [Gaiellaceae bacterium]|nr:alpha/beta hydrolase [Gaiellaceae bacterium]
MRLHVHEWGAPGAPHVVCLHGITGHGRRFRKLAEERLARRFHVLAPDLRGHGRSPWDEPWTLAAHVEDVLETFGEPAAWVGHSFGGRLVMEVAARRPEIVERAALLDPAMNVPQDFARQLAEYESTPKRFASVEEAFAERSVDLLHTPRELVEEELREHLVRDEGGRYGYRYSQPCIAATYLELTAPPPAYERLRLPTLLLVGAGSKVVGAGEAELYRRALGALLELAVVPGGHSVLWDAFAETADRVETFLAAS